MSSKTTLRVLDIVNGTTVDGPGFRTSIYFAGCLHHCSGCHNPQSWQMDGGNEMSIESLLEIVRVNDMDVTLSGGDPVYQSKGVAELCSALKSAGRNVWLYTGYLYEELIDMPECSDLLANIDVVVDGPFIENLRDTTLLFRGSSNQRIIDVAASRLCGRVELWQSDF